MAGLTRGSSARQQALASVSKRGLVAFALCCFLLRHSAGSSQASLPCCVSITISRRDVCVGNELQLQNRALSLSCALAFVSKLDSGKRNVTTTCPQGAQQGDRHVQCPLLRPSCTNVSMYVTHYCISALRNFVTFSKVI